jgi:hypothetical protein
MTERYPEHYAAQPASYSQQPQPAPYPQPHAQQNSLQLVDSAQPQRVMPDPGVTYPVQKAMPPQQVRGTNVMSILSLVFAFVFAPLGIVFGHIAKKQIRRTGEGGSGLATAGLVLGYIFAVLWILYVIFIIVVLVLT